MVDTDVNELYVPALALSPWLLATDSFPTRPPQQSAWVARVRLDRGRWCQGSIVRRQDRGNDCVVLLRVEGWDGGYPVLPRRNGKT